MPKLIIMKLNYDLNSQSCFYHRRVTKIGGRMDFLKESKIHPGSFAYYITQACTSNLIRALPWQPAERHLHFAKHFFDKGVKGVGLMKCGPVRVVTKLS